MFGGEGYKQVHRVICLYPTMRQQKLIAFWGGKQDFLEGFSLSEKVGLPQHCQLQPIFNR